jgi:hypothetical protein
VGRFVTFFCSEAGHNEGSLKLLEAVLGFEAAVDLAKGFRLKPDLVSAHERAEAKANTTHATATVERVRFTLASP